VGWFRSNIFSFRGNESNNKTAVAGIRAIGEVDIKKIIALSFAVFTPNRKK
jgi:hypothetical protein